MLIRVVSLVGLLVVAVSHGKECPAPRNLASLYRKNVMWMNNEINWRNRVIKWLKDLEEKCSNTNIGSDQRFAFPCPDHSEVQCFNASSREERTDLSNCTIASCKDGKYIDNGVLEYIWQQDSDAYNDMMTQYEEHWSDCLKRECPGGPSETPTTPADYQDIGATATTQSPISYPTDEDGWIVIQRRLDGSVNFNRSWTEYVNGFGNPDGEFWLGLEAIHQLTITRDKILRIEMIENGTDEHFFEEYGKFVVGYPWTNYFLEVYFGFTNLVLAFERNVFEQFSTYDFNNDDDPQNCAAVSGGGWWYLQDVDTAVCHYTNPNGLYGVTESPMGLVTYEWRKNIYRTLRFTEMKIRDKVTVSQGNVRLADGGNHYGRVEIRYNGVWGTICDDSWKTENSRVVCHALGFADVSHELEVAQHGTGLILLDDVDCIGNETSIFDCRHDGMGIHNCDHTEDVSIVCQE